MTRPRKADEARATARDATRTAKGPSDPAAVERERVTDLLVQLTGARVRDTIDPEDVRHDRMLAWLAAEARAALTPAERRELAEDGDRIVARIRARRGGAQSQD